MLINTHSYYSLKYGTLSVDDLILTAKELGHTSIALTDINNTSAALEFYRRCQSAEIHPVFGIDFRNGSQQKYIGLAQNNNGFFALNQHLSAILAKSTSLTNDAPFLDQCWIIYPYGQQPYRPLMSHEFIGIAPQHLNKLRIIKNLDTSRMVCLCTATFRHKRDFNVHRLLRAIDINQLLSKIPLSEQGLESHRFFSTNHIEELYADFPEVFNRTEQLLKNCQLSFDIGKNPTSKNQSLYTQSAQQDDQLIEKLCYEGIAYRYANCTEAQLEAVHIRIKKELHLIRLKNFVSYFLINWDIVNYARSCGYFYVGRGSGANSIVAYLLRITDVDPIELDLYFERFINLYRQTPPDFDIDFSWTDRDEVMDYIFRTFPNVTLLGAYSTFQRRAVVRELGKVFGLTKDEIDELVQDGIKAHATDDSYTQLIYKYSQLIHGFPSHLTMHTCGILISQEPIYHYSATFVPPKGYPTTHFDMHTAEDIGLHKFDILSQRGLAKIKDTLKIIEYNQPGTVLDVHDINRFKQDPAINSMLRNAQALGCFYIESPAMRMLITKLKVDHYLGLVAASSVIRPGVSSSGMMQEFIKRYRNPEYRKEAHPELLKIMPETFGVMVYQEDVIKVAHLYGGLTLDEADSLRRGMSGKYRSREEFEQVKKQFITNCTQKGYPLKDATIIWNQIESFAGYAFAKGHSASYAVESYQCLFLKTYFPLEYMVACINNFGGFYDTEFYVHEARMLGASIQPPCINRSFAYTHIYGTEIFLGYMHVQHLNEKTIIMVVQEREKNGVFTSFDDFIDRVPISYDQLSLLIRLHAFRQFTDKKIALLWEAHYKLNHRVAFTTDLTLFKKPPIHYTLGDGLPEFDLHPLLDSFDQKELLGFALRNPFELINPDSLIPFAEAAQHQATHLPQLLKQCITILGYLVTVKVSKTNRGEYMAFGFFTDREGHFFDTVHFPMALKSFPFRGKGVYAITGTVECEFDHYTVNVNHLQKLPFTQDDREQMDLYSGTKIESVWDED
jgi:DNA polymerase-3 subunit alpha